MSGKSKNRRLQSRRFRRVFKRTDVELGAKMSGHRINRHQWGSGIGRGHCKEISE